MKWDTKSLDYSSHRIYGLGLRDIHVMFRDTQGYVGTYGVQSSGEPWRIRRKRRWKMK